MKLKLEELTLSEQKSILKMLKEINIHEDNTENRIDQQTIICKLERNVVKMELSRFNKDEAPCDYPVEQFEELIRKPIMKKKLKSKVKLSEHEHYNEMRSDG